MLGSLSHLIFSDKYLSISFYGTGSLPADASKALMFDRIEKIIRSFKLQLSPEALQQKAEAESQFPDLQYSRTREPENWQYFESVREGDPLEGEDTIIFEGEFTPPPRLDNI